MKPLPTFIAILLLLGLTGGGMFLLKKFMPVAEKEERQKVVVGIEVMEVKASDKELTIFSQGLVRPTVETMVTSEVAGLVTEVSPKFETGEDFEKGDFLARLDDTDYQAALAQAVAEERAAKLDYELELSRKAQALRDWKELGGDRVQSELAKREPHVAAAEARWMAAQKAVEKAEKDLERTELVARYNGRVRSTSVDVGAYITPGMRVAELYGTDFYEVRLPVSLDDFSYVDVNAPGESVKLKATVGGETKIWDAKILRTEGQIDRASRSVFLVAGLEAEEGGFSREDVLAPNLFVKAEVQGLTLKGVMPIPRRAFVGTDRVLVLDNENKLRFRKVAVEQEGLQERYVKVGIDENGVGILDGEKICVTALAAVVDGMDVRVIDEEKVEAEKSGGEKPEKPTAVGAASLK